MNWGLPTPYPDELGHSVLARYYEQWENLDCNGLLMRVAGARFLHTHPTTVPAMNRVAAAAYPTSPSPVPLFIERHTLIPYAMAFEPKEVKQRAVDALTTNDRASALRVLTINAFRHSWPRTMRLCRESFEKELQLTGQPYWHRTHHLPGIDHCVRHFSRLHNTSQPFGIMKVAEPRTPLRVSCTFDSKSEVKPLFHRALERALVAHSLSALGWGPSFTKERLVERNRARVRCLYPTELGHVIKDMLESDFANWLRRNRLSGEWGGDSGEWVPHLVRNSRVRLGTLQHLVLQAFLDGKGRLAPIRKTTSRSERRSVPNFRPQARHQGQAA